MQDYHLRSFEDIEKEKDSLIDEINKNKINIENQITNVVNKLDNTIEEINKQTSLNVENTNSFRETLEKLYYSKLKSASNSLKISISVFEEKTKTLKSEFWKISAIIIILIVSLTGEIVQNNLSMNSVGQITQNNTSVSPSLTNSIIQLLLSLIPYIVILIILLSIYLVFKAYKNINSIDNISELRTEVNNIDKNMTPAPTMPQSPEKIEVEKPFFDEKKTILSSFISSVGKSIPVVSNIYDEVTLLVEYQQMVKDFEMCLEFYELVENESFFEELGRGVPADVHILNSDNLWKNIVAKKISSQLSKQILGQKITLSENIILLLYSEHNGEPSTSIFRELVDSDDEIQALASVLIHSQKLIKSGGYEYKIEDIAAIIRTIESFSLSNINNILSSSFLTLNYLNSYVEFLEKNDIDTSYELTIEFVIHKSNNNNNSFEERVVELAYRIGLDIFNKFDNLDKDFVDGFARASIALKFHNDISLRKIACKFSATDHSTSVLYSYYEKIKENDGQKVVSIKQLISDVEIVKSFLIKLEDPDIKFFQAQLKDGKWYDSSYSLLRHFFEKSKEEISEKLSNIEEFEILKESIRSTYQEVSIETLEKSIDAQIFGAYVIMFHSSGSQNSDKRDESKKDEDTLRKIIDKLSIRDLDQNDRDNKWEFKKDREIEEITKMYGVRPKYDFINFSNSTRIGILNKNQSFQPFKKEFLNDVKTILNLKDEPFDIGIVVLKIMPSKYSFGILDKEGLSNKIEIKDIDAVKYIARLATKIPLEDQVSGMKFEKNIDLLKIVNEESFYEIIKINNDDIADNEKRVLSKPELTEHLLRELNEKVSITDFKSLALDLKDGNYEEETIKEINKVIESVLSHVYLTERGLKRKAKDRPKVLSKRFTKSLTNLASLYKLQRSN